MQITITSSDTAYNTTDVTKAIDLNARGLPICGPTDVYPQVAMVMAWCNGSSGSGTIRMGLVDDTQVYFYRDLTVTATSVATALGGTGSSYVATVSASDSSDNKVDLLGSWDGKGSNRRRWVVWAPSAFTTITSITLDFEATPVL